jgi:hypothetical protein
MNVDKVKKYLFFFLFINCANTFCYIHSLTKNGTQVRWPLNATQLNLFLNPENSQGLSVTDVTSIASSSITEWNGNSKLRVSMGTTAGRNQNGLNEIYFSSDSSVFNGTGVVGVTQVSYREDDGIILEADILINDTFDFGTNINAINYLGNVITHEAGHFLGLSHGQVSGSTMFYALSRGQNKIELDDAAGIFSIYPNINNAKKSITGKVVGGKNLYGIFGAHVEAISLKTGKVSAASISAIDGSFEIMGLPINDKYFLYVKPVMNIGIPSYYGTAKNNFCDGGASYRGSFFQSCGANNEGYPQALSLTSNNANVGNLTVRCSVDVPPEYFAKKNSSIADYELALVDNLNIGNAFVGFFSNLEMDNATSFDSFKIDLTSISSVSLNQLSNRDLYLELQVLNQNLNSMFKANVEVTHLGVVTTPSNKYAQNPDGWIDINTIIRLPIDKNAINSNYFEIKITPESMAGILVPSGIPYSKADIFPSYSLFGDSLYFYLVNTHLVTDNGDGTFSSISSRAYQNSDNTACTDANSTYQLSNYSTGSSSATGSRTSVSACGTIDTSGNDNNQNGPMTMALGFLFAFILFEFSKKLRFR